jgi:peroxiredoxin
MKRSVWCLLALAALWSAAEGGKFNKKLNVGDPAPVWSALPGVDGKAHSLSDYDSRLLVVVFTCNRCPIAVAYQDRLNRIAADYKDKGVRLVAINVNSGKAESLEKMSARAKEKKFAFDYLKDEGQSSAKAYGARTTPTVFLLNQERKVAYMGAVDDNWEAEAAVERPYLREAIDALLAGNLPEVGETLATGCGIPFHKDDEE